MCRREALAHRRVAESNPELVENPSVRNAARLRHERKRHRRQHLAQLRSSHAHGPGVSEALRSEVEVIAHLHVRCIDGVVRPPRAGSKQCHTGQPRKVLRVDVIGVYILVLDEHRIAAPEPGQRQAIGSIDARRAKQADPRPGTPAETTQLPLRIDPPPCARRARPAWACLVDPVPAAIAIDPRRADVDNALW